MSPEHRQSILAALADVHARVRDASPDAPSPILSQGWVDRRRLLLVDLAMHLAEEAMRGEAVGARSLAEKLFEVLEVARVLAPGHGVDAAAEAVLRALGGEDGGEDGQAGGG